MLLEHGFHPSSFRLHPLLISNPRPAVRPMPCAAPGREARDPFFTEAVMKLAQQAKSLLVVAVVLSLLVAVVLSSLPAGAQTQRRRASAAGQRAQNDIERKIDALLARMTLEEKLGQLQQLGGDVAGHANADLYDIARRGLLGSTLGVRGARNANNLQRAAA